MIRIAEWFGDNDCIVGKKLRGNHKDSSINKNLNFVKLISSSICVIVQRTEASLQNLTMNYGDWDFRREEGDSIKNPKGLIIEPTNGYEKHKNKHAFKSTHGHSSQSFKVEYDPSICYKDTDHKQRRPRIEVRTIQI